MRQALAVIIAILIFCCAIPGAAAAVSMEINATPAQAHIGDVITLTGKVSGLKTIAVYLFVTGPDLDNRGVTLENLNILAGRGLFTTAPVNLDDGTWRYDWDTSVILGTPIQGNYTVYVASTPVDRLRYTRGVFATAQVEFLPSDTPANDVPLSPFLSIAALISMSCAIFLTRHLSQD
jgi:hypothetical protein